MFNWLKTQITKFFNWLFSLSKEPSSQSLRNNSELIEIANTIRIIGDRGCGKTTYLAALIRYPNPDPDNYPIQKIVPLSGPSEELEIQATNILEEGREFAPSPVLAAQLSAGALPNFGFAVTLKDKKSRLLKLEIFCRDYSGEILGDIGTMSEQTLESYISDCADPSVEGIILLIDATKHREDLAYEISVRTFIRRLIVSRIDGWRGRLAITLTKCEDQQLYGKRKELGSNKLMQKYFPKTLHAIVNNINNDISIEYFSLSAFGMMGHEDAKRPNVEYVKDPTNPTKQFARLKNIGVWRPFGLVAPLYWLCTGDRHPNLE